MVAIPGVSHIGMRNVEGSGLATRSLSFTSLKPAMDEPSNPMP